MSLLRNLFKPAGLAPAYAGVKKVLGSVYRPINRLVNKAANTVLALDEMVGKASDHPVLRDLAGLVRNNPFYQEVINISKDVRDGVNYLGDFSNVVDGAILSKLPKSAENPKMEAKAGAVADALGIKGDIVS